MKIMKKKFTCIKAGLLFLYFFLILIGIVLNPEIKNIEKEEIQKNNEKKYATLVDSKGQFIVYNKEEYEAWIDIEFLKRRNFYNTYKYILNSRYSDEQIENRTFLKWGRYETYGEALEDLGTLATFASITTINERIYNEFLNIYQIIGKVDNTQFGIETYLKNKRMLENEERIEISLDLKLQSMLEEELEKIVKEREAEGAIGIIMNTKTGKIRASVTTYPWNMAYMGYIEPGSTLKPMLYALALDQNIVHFEEIFNPPQTIKPLDNINFTVSEIENRYFGETNLKNALIHSSNVIMIQTIQRMMEEYSTELLYTNLVKMGFGEKTNIEFEGEIRGILPNPRDWYPITPYQFAIGQGIGVTPIQLLSSFNAVINDGTYVKPTLLNDAEIETYQLYSTRTSEILREWMSYITISGTARGAHIDGIRVGGKTGTAEKALPGIGYTKENYYSLFTGYYPATNPIYTFLIIVDNPKGEYYGGEVAAPIITKLFYDYHKSENTYSEQKEILFYEYMPNLQNKSTIEAYNILLNLGIKSEKIVFSGNGDSVKDQMPKSGTNLSQIEYIQLFF
jgi:cell division protein FtsI (penicillin-binding protein 3)